MLKNKKVEFQNNGTELTSVGTPEIFLKKWSW
jgi:hypothetical protein